MIIFNPLEQFELHYLLIIINNFNYVLLLTLVLYLLISSSLVVDLVNDLTDGLSIKGYESFIFMIFLLLLITNVLGLFGTAINAQLVYTIGISLGLRLGANLLSGHLLVDIVATLIYSFGALSIALAILGTLLFGLLIAIQLLEIAIALIQVYVFSILTVNYLKDVVDLH